MTQINLSFPQAGGFTLSTLGVQGPSTGGGVSSWNDLTDKPTEFPPEDHTHAIADVLLLQGALDGKATAAQGALADSALQPGAEIPWTDVTGKPASFPPSTHGHAISDVTGLTAALDGKADDAHTHVIADVTGLQTALDDKQADLGFTPENVAQKGVAGGYAGLDGTGRVPAGQLPSFVDDVIEVANFAALPVTGEAGKIYITADDNAQFRWSGSAYVQITASPGSTDAVPEGATNLYFTEPRVRGTVLTGYAAAGSRTALAAADSILGAFNKIGKWLGDLAAVAFSGSASDLTAGTLPAARFDDTAHGNRAGGALHPAATTSVAGFMSSADKTKLDAITGTNTGDQASIVGITGTKAQFDAAVTDGSIMYVGDAPTAHTHTTTDITGFAEAVDDRVAGLLVEGPNVTLTYDDVAGTLTIEAAGGGGGGVPSGTGSPEGAVTAPVGSLFLQTDGDPSGVLWVKESGTGSTGWNRVLTLDANSAPTGALSIPTLRILAGEPADYPPAGFPFPPETPLIFISPTEIVYAYWYPDDGFGNPYHDIIATEPRGGGGGGATGGSAVLDFGAAPGSSVAEVTVTGQTGILVGSRPRAWVQGSTADHNEYEHSRILPGRVGVGVSDIVAGVGFTICAETEMRLTGLVAVKWEWQ